MVHKSPYKLYPLLITFVTDVIDIFHIFSNMYDTKIYRDIDIKNIHTDLNEIV